MTHRQNELVYEAKYDEVHYCQYVCAISMIYQYIFVELKYTYAIGIYGRPSWVAGRTLINVLCLIFSCVLVIFVSDAISYHVSSS